MPQRLLQNALFLQLATERNRSLWTISSSEEINCKMKLNRILSTESNLRILHPQNSRQNKNSVSSLLRLKNYQLKIIIKLNLIFSHPHKWKYRLFVCINYQGEKNKDRNRDRGKEREQDNEKDKKILTLQCEEDDIDPFLLDSISVNDPIWNQIIPEGLLNTVNLEKLIEDNPEYFHHQLGLCACFRCRCGRCKCDAGN